MTLHSDALLPLDAALGQLQQRLSCVCLSEAVALRAALGRVLAQDVISPCAVPPFANSAMDGYALRASEFSAEHTFAMAGKALAGAPCEAPIPAGACVRIMTGAPLPVGMDAVIMQEEALVVAEGVRFSVAPTAGQFVRAAGSDIAQGSVVLRAGTRLTARELPLLASLGIAKVAVHRRLKVALISSGDELVAVGQPLAAGKIYDSNRYGLVAMLERMGVECVDFGIIPDDPAALRTAFMQADSQCDALITSGGVSVGEADFTKATLAQLGEVGFWRLAIKPGKPFAFGRLNRAWFFGLPGNPVSAMVTFDQLVRPALAKLGGETWQAPLRLRARAASTFKKAPGRLDFQRGIARHSAEGLDVVTTGSQDSAVFSSLSQANCYVVLERERGAVAVGEWVTVELFSAVLA
ncbi:MAG: molybdopterin molybdotransferase MoeA [Aeromonas sp.]